MKGEVFYGKGIRELEDEHPDLYDLVKNINETVWSGNVLDYKTQKLIAIGITASRADPRATKKQIQRKIILGGKKSSWTISLALLKIKLLLPRVQSL